VQKPVRQFDFNLAKFPTTARCRAADRPFADFAFLFLKGGLAMSNVVEIKDEEFKLESDAAIAIERIRGIGKVFNFVQEGLFWQENYGDFVQNMGEVLEEEIEKIHAYMFPKSA
jgi:hypothetical protein